jgi:hypothetical protein
VVVAPNNYFIAFGILFSGMGAVMAIIAIKTAKGERRIIIFKEGKYKVKHARR